MAQQRHRPATSPGPARARPAPLRPAGPSVSALSEVISPAVVAAGYDLEDLQVTRIGRRVVVRVVVDCDEGVSLEAVAEVSRRVSAALDAVEATGTELIGQEYELEVSSPGVDRPLNQPRHWRRNVGRLVKVTAGRRPLIGRIGAASDAGVVLEVKGTDELVPYDRLGPGRVQIEFARLDAVTDDELDEMADPDDGADEADMADETEEDAE